MKISELPEIDEPIFQNHWQSDVEILKLLLEGGDQQHIEREIDFAFQGSMSALQNLSSTFKQLGFERFELIPAEKANEQPWLVLYKSMGSDSNSLKSIIRTCLRIAKQYGLSFDGWGCEVQGMTVQ